MVVTLSPQKRHIALRRDFVTDKATTIRVEGTQENGAFGIEDFTARRSDGSVLLKAERTERSSSRRKEIKDASGLPMYNLRCEKSSLYTRIQVELPGDNHEILQAKWSLSLTRMNFDYYFKNVDGEDLKLSLRSQDYYSTEAWIKYGEEVIAVVRRLYCETGSQKMIVFKNQFEIDVTEGVDLSLVSDTCTRKGTTSYC
jgi:uncharacterized protein YxjI